MTREERLEAALRDAVRQIEYLHDKFQPTGSGNAVLAQCRAALDAPPAAEAPAARVSERGEGRGQNSNVPKATTKESLEVRMDPAERGFVGAVYTATGPWKPTDPTIEAGDVA